MRNPDFKNNILKTIRRQKPDNHCLFEFFICSEAEEALSGMKLDSDPFTVIRRRIKAFYNAGYDFVPLMGSGFRFTRSPHTAKASFSLNEGGLITDMASFEKYKWNEPQDFSCEVLEKLSPELPDGMKFMIYSADGVLENVIGLTGYDNLCYMLADDRELVRLIFKNVGNRLIKYHELCAQFDSVGILFSNDDWGFKTGTMISHSDLKEFVYPYHKRIAETAHNRGLPCVMHSCGQFGDIYKDLYEVIGFDGKHSNEDTILPVEEAYKKYGDKISIMGGIDIDFLCRSDEKAVTRRCMNMLEISSARGGYALGSGNSIPNYIPFKNYLAMLRCVNPGLRLPQ